MLIVFFFKKKSAHFKSAEMSMKHFLMHGRHIPFLLGIQVAFIVLFGVFVEYDKEAHSARAFDKDANATKNEGNSLQHYYPSTNDY